MATTFQMTNKTHIMRLMLNIRTFCIAQKTEPFYMSGYQALQKKRTNVKSSNLQWNPESLTLKQNQWIMDATKPHEVMRIVTETLQSKLDPVKMSVVFNCAIRKCVELHAYPQCWTLFVSAKETSHLNTQLYTTMVWMCLNSSRRAHFNKALELYNEMKSNGFAVTNHTYAALMSGAAKKLCYDQGIAIWKDMQNDGTVVLDAPAWNAIITLYCFNKDMKNAAQTYHDMQHKANVVPDNYTFSALLNGYSAAIAHVVKFDVKGVDLDEYVTLGENVFYDAVMIWENNGSNSSGIEKEQSKRMFVIQAWMNLYASVGDIYSCVTIFKWLLRTNGIDFEYDMKMNKRRKNDIKDLEEWLNDSDNILNGVAYKIRIQIFGIVLKACLNKVNLAPDKLRSLIECVMDTMRNQCDIKPSTDIYGIVFQLYRRMMDHVDVKQLEQLYEQMKHECESKPTERELNEYARTYLSFMDHNGGTKSQKKDFVSSLMDEFKELKVTPSIYTKQLVREQLTFSSSS
eukprot:278672_1